MPRLVVIVWTLLSASFCGSQVCHNYAVEPDPMALASFPTTADIWRMDADGTQLCWSAGITQYTELSWCAIDADGVLTPQGSLRLQRNGVDFGSLGLQVDGNRAVVRAGDGGWQIVDFSIPAAPVVMWEAPAGAVIGDPVLRGVWLYAPTTAGLAVMELVAGEPPFVRALVDFPDPDCYGSGFYSMKLAVHGDRCWIVASRACGGYTRDTLNVVDIGDPVVPAVLSRLPLSGSSEGINESYRNLEAGQGAAILSRMTRYYSGHPYDWNDVYETLFFELDAGDEVSQTTVFASYYGDDAAIAGNHAWVAEGRVIRYFDRSNGVWYKRQAIAAGATDHPHLIIEGGVIWTGSERSIKSWRSILPETAPILSVAHDFTSSSCSGLDVVHDHFVAQVYSYSRETSSLIRLDATDARRLAASPRFADTWPGFAFCNIVDNRAYTSGGIWDLDSQTRVSARSPEVFGASGTALWAVNGGRLETYDGADPATPALHGTYFAIDGGYGDRPNFAVEADLAVFAHADTLIAADVSEPLDPMVLHRLMIPGLQVRDLILQDGLLYVADQGGLSVVGVATDGSMKLRGVLEGAAGGLAALEPDGGILYAIESGSFAVQVIDISDPALPSLIADTAIYGHDLKRLGEVVYVRSSATITAIKPQCASTVPVSLRELNLAWRDGSARLSWNMDSDLAGVRVLARADGREWIVPWRDVGGACVAVDHEAPAGLTVTYAIQLLSDGRWLTLAEESLTIPATRLFLRAPSPNPFNPETVIAFAVDRSGPVELTIMDAAGRRVRALLADELEAGEYTAIWRGDDDAGRSLAGGVYLIRLATSRGERSVKVTLLK